MRIGGAADGELPETIVELHHLKECRTSAIGLALEMPAPGIVTGGNREKLAVRLQPAFDFLERRIFDMTERVNIHNTIETTPSKREIMDRGMNMGQRVLRGINRRNIEAFIR